MKIKFLTVLSLAVVLLLGACGGKSDAELKTAAETALKANTATSGVNVEVKDGVATISGEVADDAAKTNAAEVVSKVEGIKSVTNNVTVKAAPPPPTASADDTTVKEKIEKGWKEKGCEGATIEVKEGVATARGNVPDAKFAECVMVLNEGGAKKVENQLSRKK